MTSQWEADAAGPETCVDCGRPSQWLRCPVCTVAHLRAYRRTIEAATGRSRRYWPHHKAA